MVALWEQRFRATRVSLPDWAADAPDRCLYVSNPTGTFELYAWDRATDTHRQVTDRRAGTHIATLPPDGETVWWFTDTDGDEFGHWVTEPFAGRERGSAGSTNRALGAEPIPALPGVEDGYPAGLDIGRRLVTAGTSTDDGTRIWLWDRTSDTPAHVVYAHPEDAGVGAHLGESLGVEKYLGERLRCGIRDGQLVDDAPVEQIGRAILGAIIVESLGREAHDPDSIVHLTRYLFDPRSTI